MITVLRQRLKKDEEDGFTLIELMVVVLIIAILIAIAIPTFLGARERSQNRAAQSSLRNALTAAKTKFTDDNTYTNATSANLTAIEPSLTFVDGSTASDGQKKVSVATPTASVWAAVVLSEGGTCYSIRDNIASGGGGTKYGAVTGACTGAGVTAANTGADKFP